MNLIRARAGTGTAAAISLAAAVSLTNSLAVVPAHEAASAGTKNEATQAQTQPGQCYRVVVERHPTLCKQWVRNLNFFCDEPPMVCGFKVHPSMKQLFSEPGWVPLDPVKDFKWVRTVYLAQVLAELPREPAHTSREVAEKRLDEKYPDLRRKAESGRLKLSRARFNPINVTSYGTPIVYRVDDLDCAPRAEDGVGQPVSPHFAVIDANTGDIDRRYDRIHEGTKLIRFEGAFSYLIHQPGAGPGDHYLVAPTETRDLCEIKREQGVRK